MKLSPIKTQLATFVICASMLCILSFTARAQTYADTIAKFRKQYIKELQEDKRTPLQPRDARYIHFFAPNRNYCVWADFTATPGSKPFLIGTHSGKQKPFREYGILTFTVSDTVCTLHAYQSVDLINDMAHKDDLFIPFTDLTNYSETFAGGRYIDLSAKDIANGRILLDFNKCYNMYCAYADGYSCPIPPSENFINVAVRAGEKMFTKNIGE